MDSAIPERKGLVSADLSRGPNAHRVRILKVYSESQKRPRQKGRRPKGPGKLDRLGTTKQRKRGPSAQRLRFPQGNGQQRPTRYAEPIPFQTALNLPPGQFFPSVGGSRAESAAAKPMAEVNCSPPSAGQKTVGTALRWFKRPGRSLPKNIGFQKANRAVKKMRSTTSFRSKSDRGFRQTYPVGRAAI